MSPAKPTPSEPCSSHPLTPNISQGSLGVMGKALAHAIPLSRAEEGAVPFTLVVPHLLCRSSSSDCRASKAALFFITW